MARKIIFIMALFFVNIAAAQRNEVGVFAGAGFYLGDLNPTGLFSQSRPALGLMYRYNLDTRWALRVNGTYGSVTASDNVYNNPRNLHFRSNIYELSVIAEVNFLTFFSGSKRLYRFSPYIFGGLALFAFNPQTQYVNPASLENTWIDLRPLRTEGQGIPECDAKYYSAVQPSIPFGIGFKYGVSKRLTLSVEWGLRATFTDYLDDVSSKYVDPTILMEYIGDEAVALSDRSETPNEIGSSRGNPNTKDWYSFAGIGLTYKLYPAVDYNCPAYRNSRLNKRYSRFE